MTKKILFSKFLIKILYPFNFLIPNHKYKNIIRVLFSAYQGLPINKGLPVNIRIAPINICNYRCLFCEIHKDFQLFPKRIINQIDVADLESIENFICSAYTVSFYGGSAEPLLNKNMKDIVPYLKKRRVKLSVTTNASMLSEQLNDVLAKFGFDKLVVSYHAGTKDKYKYLTSGGNLDNVQHNILDLASKRKQTQIWLNFALNKENLDEYQSIIDFCKLAKLNGVLMNKYYGGRNKLQDKKVSFDYNPDEGNKILDAIYAYAKTKKVNINPKKPQYFQKRSVVKQWNSLDVKKFNCFAPWKDLHFNPVLNEKDCFYVGVCNRIELFKVNKKFFRKNKVETLWNHPLIQYLRKTANSVQGNSICNFCKNVNTANIRNTNPDQYAQLRDKAVYNFFKEFTDSYQFYQGLFVLNENPYDDKKLSKL